MDRSKVVDILGLIPNGDFEITGVKIVQWGRDLVFDCQYQTLQPDGTPDPLVEFQLMFRDCREFTWKTYAHIALAETGKISLTSELAEFSMGKGNHRRDASLLTSHFGVTLSYGRLIINYDNQAFEVD